LAFPADRTLIGGLLSHGTEMTNIGLAEGRNRNQNVRTVVQIVGMCAAMSFAMSAYGREVDVSVFDREGRPVEDVVVYALRRDGYTTPLKPEGNAVMDQIDMQFVPHVLVVQSGTAVDFPNSDSVAHHVYSFSHPNKFVLQMYKGEKHPPVNFEHSGVVSLGCNIHDHMLGYILVIDSTIFAKTKENGQASLSLDNPEEYSITIWSPRIRDKAELLSKTVAISDASRASLTFSLAKKLNPPHDSRNGDAAWSDY
jgi:plastocyanin